MGRWVAKRLKLLWVPSFSVVFAPTDLRNCSIFRIDQDEIRQKVRQTCSKTDNYMHVSFLIFQQTDVVGRDFPFCWHSSQKEFHVSRVTRSFRKFTCLFGATIFTQMSLKFVTYKFLHKHNSRYKIWHGFKFLKVTRSVAVLTHTHTHRDTQTHTHLCHQRQGTCYSLKKRQSPVLHHQMLPPFSSFLLYSWTYPWFLFKHIFYYT